MKSEFTPQNHPYMKTLQDTLTPTKQKLECLEQRVMFLGLVVDDELALPYDKNEAKIKIIETKSEIEALKRVIREKEAYFMKFMAQYIEDLDEVDSNFDSVVSQAKKQAETDVVLSDLLAKIHWEGLEQNNEAKIYFYKQIKKRLV